MITLFDEKGNPIKQSISKKIEMFKETSTAVLLAPKEKKPKKPITTVSESIYKLEGRADKSVTIGILSRCPIGQEIAEYRALQGECPYFTECSVNAPRRYSCQPCIVFQKSVSPKRLKVKQG